MRSGSAESACIENTEVIQSHEIATIEVVSIVVAVGPSGCLFLFLVCIADFASTKSQYEEVPGKIWMVSLLSNAYDSACVLQIECIQVLESNLDDVIIK